MATSQGQLNVNLNNILHTYFKIREIDSEGFEVQAFGINFIFVKNGNDLIIFKEEEREIDGKVMTLTLTDNTTHIDYNGTKIYFNQYVVADMDYIPIIKSIIGYLSLYYKP